jgi:hypothetical protein
MPFKLLDAAFTCLGNGGVDCAGHSFAECFQRGGEYVFLIPEIKIETARRAAGGPPQRSSYWSSAVNGLRLA